MVFSSSIFLLLFLPLFLVIYQITPKSYKNYLILFASLIFYSWGAPKFLFVLLTTSIVDYYLINYLHYSKLEKQKKLILTISITLNLGLLAYFKYANFFVENFNITLSNLGYSNIKWISIGLPIGISFFTFQSISYSVDVYRKTHPPLAKVTDYLLFIFSFPQMIAGPIVRFTSIADQITNRLETYEDKLIGFYRFCIGLAKKVLIANVLGEYADNVLDGDLSNISSITAWLGILAYTFQIYFDFSGYSDMAIGLGKMMGFSFPENFNSPYTAKSITNFWKKWHITLGDFMRDYVYIPLGGNRFGKSRTYLNLCIVFLLSGFWHGASYNFILWGAYYGFFMILDRLFLEKLLQKSGALLSNSLTFLVVVLGWVIFRLEQLTDIQIYFIKLLSFDLSTLVPQNNFIIIMLLIAFCFSFLTNIEIGKSLNRFYFEKNKYSVKQHLMLSIASLVFFILSLSAITASNFNPFIYFKF